MMEGYMKVGRELLFLIKMKIELPWPQLDEITHSTTLDESLFIISLPWKWVAKISRALSKAPLHLNPLTPTWWEDVSNTSHLSLQRVSPTWLHLLAPACLATLSILNFNPTYKGGDQWTNLLSFRRPHTIVASQLNIISFNLTSLNSFLPNTHFSS